MGNRFHIEISAIAGHDPVLRYTTSGTAVTTVRCAVNFPDGQGGQRVTWYALVFWGKLAQPAAERIKKGYHVVASGGEVRLRQWTAKDGTINNQMEIPVARFETHPPAKAINGSNTVDKEKNQIAAELKRLRNLQKQLEAGQTPEQQIVSKIEELTKAATEDKTVSGDPFQS